MINNHYNLAVIGGGPAGMMAAGRAGALGASVILLEKNSHLGVKLMMTGKGRCNITNNESNPKKLVEKYEPNGKFLFSALTNFTTADTINFFEKFDITTKIEDNGRVFPTSDLAKTVLDALTQYLRDGQVEIKLNSAVKQIVVAQNKIEKIILESGAEIIADNYLIATGGKSYPQTGSTGDGYHWLKKIGHNIITPKPALTPIEVKEKWIKDLEGLSLKDVAISLCQNHKKRITRQGEAVFTANGLSGPIIFDLSRFVSMPVDDDQKLSLNFFPDSNRQELEEKLYQNLQQNNKKIIKNILEQWLTSRLVTVLMTIAQISPDKKANEISKIEQKKLVDLLSNLTLNIEKIGTFDKAIITMGGIDTTEVNPKTFQSKKISNLYLAGEILDIAGPTGGYNLQICWSSGYLAGENIAQKN